MTSALPADLGRIPMSVEIDFGRMVREAEATGRFDPNSIEVVDLTTGKPVAFARTEDFAYGDRGRIEWVIENPDHTDYEIRFRTRPERQPLQPQKYTPMVGVGDLLRYNAGVPRPIALSHSMRLVDITGDGRADLAGCWNYYYRPGSPVSGIVCYPRVGPDENLTFGDLARLRYVEKRGSRELKHFPAVYAEADFSDLNGNGLPDIVYAGMRDTGVTVYLNSGERDGGGLPVFVKDIVNSGTGRSERGHLHRGSQRERRSRPGGKRTLYQEPESGGLAVQGRRGGGSTGRETARVPGSRRRRIAGRHGHALWRV